MTKTEFTPLQSELLDILMEEFAEVIKAIIKSRRFGLDNVYDGVDNHTAIEEEIADVIGVIELLKEFDVIRDTNVLAFNTEGKIAKVRKYLKNPVKLVQPSVDTKPFDDAQLQQFGQFILDHCKKITQGYRSKATDRGWPVEAKTAAKHIGGDIDKLSVSRLLSEFKNVATKDSENADSSLQKRFEVAKREIDALPEWKRQELRQYLGIKDPKE